MVALEKRWTPAEIKENIIHNDQWLTRGLLAIFNKQTASEQEAENTMEDNKVGFSGAHAEFASSLAKQLQKGWKLSQKQVVAARKIMVHYSSQLAKIANGEI